MIKFWRLYYNKNKIIININYHNFLNNHNFTSPEQAHKNAVELAEHTKAWKGHEVLIATHIDKGHIHTHFIVNSVNYENGHKLQWM
ncbi:relaxase/mobilization nuclease domain-containing protein [Campylobacter coli]|nr:relaxase/mobilization nuclease domain-containing protein [Campylobacter coli]ELB3889082.1 relaxase/mobilization nuclease domain-containing protein [Campylobacter coli]